jgi:hypothetical protein
MIVWTALGLLSAAFLAVVLVCNVHAAATDARLVRYCAGGFVGRTWQGAPPPWAATDARRAAVCATTAWLREEFGWRPDDD